MTESATAEDRKKLHDLIKGIRTAMLTTVDEDGSLHSRPMGNENHDEFDGELLFLTSASAHKALEIGHDNRVSVAFSEPKSQTYVAVSGTGRLLRDRAKAEKIWSAFAKIWFPKGLDDPDLAVLSVTVEKAEYWDAPSGAVVLVYGLVTQAITGHPPKVGENKKLSL
jgi:general stress protein 26